MAKQNQGKFNVAGRLGTGKPAAAAAASPDDILLRPASPPVPATVAAAEPTDEKTLLRFGSQLPVGDLVAVHRIAYWQRVPLYEVLSEAIRLYATTQPEATKPLPEKERATRKLPQA